MKPTFCEKMAATWALTMLLCALVSADADAYYFAPSSIHFTSNTPLALSHPLRILPEKPYAVAPSLAPTPLYVVPRALIRLLDPSTVADPSAVTPGVRVVLRQPLVISSPQAMISFPSGFTVDHEPGVRMPMNVGAILAPVATAVTYPIQYPITVRIVYAVATIEPETSPFFTEPYYQFPGYYHQSYAYQTALAVPKEPVPAEEKPVSSLETAKPDIIEAVAAQKPTSETEEAQEKPGVSPAGSPQLITVLDFPSSVATPGALFFQPPLSGEELGNREPPQAIVPAGIVQSAAPIPNLSVFVNSKESQYLQILREESLKTKTPQRTPTFIYHGDVIQVDAL